MDAHAHVGKIELMGWLDPPEKIIESMNRTGIDMAVVCSDWDTPGPDPQDKDMVVKAIKKYPNRLIGFVRVNPWFKEEALDELEKAITKLGFRGLKLHTTTSEIWPYCEPVLSLLRRAAELDVPVYYHSGDEPMSTPLQIEKAAVACPTTKIIMGHMGGFLFCKDAIRIAKRRNNIILETSVMPYPNMIRKAIDELGPEKVVFGSDGPLVNPSVELLKIELADVSKEEKELVLGRNILNILKL